MVCQQSCDSGQGVYKVNFECLCFQSIYFRKGEVQSWTGLQRSVIEGQLFDSEEQGGTIGQSESV